MMDRSCQWGALCFGILSFPQRNCLVVCLSLSESELYTIRLLSPADSCFLEDSFICDNVEKWFYSSNLIFIYNHLESPKKGEVIDHNCLSVWLLFSCSCCDDWPIKLKGKQTTLHRKHAVTNLDLLLLEPDSVSTHYPLGHMMSWLITHRHPATNRENTQS